MRIWRQYGTLARAEICILYNIFVFWHRVNSIWGKHQIIIVTPYRNGADTFSPSFPFEQSTCAPDCDIPWLKRSLKARKKVCVFNITVTGYSIYIPFNSALKSEIDLWHFHFHTFGWFLNHSRLNIVSELSSFSYYSS